MMRTSATRDLVKVVYRLPPESWHGHTTETLWAQMVSENKYRLRSVPFYAKGLSYNDVVVGQAEGDHVVFSAVALHGGHSTYRVFLRDNVDLDTNSFLDHWRPLHELGCTFERATHRLLAVDVPPTADIVAVYNALQRGEDDGIWDFEEGHCGQR